MQKEIQSNRIMGFFHGIDPATQNDYYTDVVHVLTEKPRDIGPDLARNYKWIPFLVDIKRLKKKDPMEIIDWQIRQFNRFPPMYATIDITREAFLSAALLRKYGESRIIPMHFGNVGSLNTKFSLKQIGYGYIHAGYEWPDHTIIEKKMPKFAKLLRILKAEMMREIATYTKNERITFDHPIGKHNDLVHGWEMSLNSVMTYQQNLLGNQRREATNPEYDTISQIYKEYAEQNKGDELADTPIFDRELGNSAFRVP